MGKNKLISSESKPKKDNFFVKAKHRKVQKQRGNFNTPDKSSSGSGTFFIKKIDQNKSNETAKSSKRKKNDDSKKPFDKKKWRLQRYSKKYKLQQWEETRKKTILKEYYKQTKEDTSAKINVQKIYDEAEQDDSNPVRAVELENENNLNSEIIETNLESTQIPTRNKKKPYLKAHEEFKRIKAEKLQRKEEIRKKKEERDKALKEYKKEKARKFKQLNKKTRKGQPVMKYRMQMLLEQIQKSTSD